jgi:hypothetical protein
LEELTFEVMNAKDSTTGDLAFAKPLANLKILELIRSDIVNFDAVADCTKLEKVTIERSTGIDSLEALKKLPNLTSLVVPKGIFPEDQLTGFANPKIKVTQR